MAFVIYKWTFSESLSPPFADAAYLPTFEMIIGFELAWIENCHPLEGGCYGALRLFYQGIF